MNKQIAVFGGSFNPPGVHHRAIAEFLSGEFDEVLIVPCGPRPDKPITNDVAPIDRAAMVDMAFAGLKKVRVDLSDLENNTFTRTHELEQRFRDEGDIWHLVGGDLVNGGRNGHSQIQREWERGQSLWHEARFAVLKRPGYTLSAEDLPPRHRVFEVQYEGASSEIRNRIFHRHPVPTLLTPRVIQYIERHGLYRGKEASRIVHWRLDTRRWLVFADDRNPQAQEIASSLRAAADPQGAEDPELIVVVGGDGTMLRAIRQYWRLRVPFYGVNTGHLGFLLNHEPPNVGDGLVLQQVPLLWAETENLQGEKQEALAFNDAWVERATGQTAWIEVKINGQVRLTQLVADGALVSTAAGSASYARAMGATPVPLNTPAILLVGSNVLQPSGWRPVVLPLSSVVELTTLQPEKRPLRAYVDGISHGEVRAMRTRTSNIAAVELAFDPRQDPSEKLAQIQFPR